MRPRSGCVRAARASGDIRHGGPCHRAAAPTQEQPDPPRQRRPWRPRGRRALSEFPRACRGKKCQGVVGTGGNDTGRRTRHGRADRRMPPNRRTRTNRALGPLEALAAPAQATTAVDQQPHLERRCACAACLRASNGGSQRHDTVRVRHDAGTTTNPSDARSSTALVVDWSGMGICWTAWRTLERSTHPQRCALGAGGLTSECLRMRMTCADGVRSSRWYMVSRARKGRTGGL